MDSKTSELVSKNDDTVESVVSTARRRRGRPRQPSFVKVEPVTKSSPPVAAEKLVLPDPRWMAEFVASFLKASR